MGNSGITHYSLFTASAQDSKNDMFNPVEHAVISQTSAPDARGAGMGDVGAATDPDVNSQYWNPAKYPFCISRAGIALNYTPWLRQLVITLLQVVRQSNSLVSDLQDIIPHWDRVLSIVAPLC